MLTVVIATCLQPIYFERSLALAIFDIVLDVGTDIMIITLPICLLWNVRIKPRQKIFLGVFLSLNGFMAIVACVRVSGLKFQGTFDEVWLYLWQFIEACVAVAMISLTAFRSVFVSSASSRARKEAEKKYKSPWYSSTLEKLSTRKKQRSWDAEAAVRGLPSIPGATLTGMRTFIQGPFRTTNGVSTNVMATIDSAPSDDSEYDTFPAAQKPGQIYVCHEVDHDVRLASRGTDKSTHGRSFV